MPHADPASLAPQPAHGDFANDIPTGTQTSADALYGRIARRLLPLLFLCYIACYLDRVNVGFAKLQMATDLGFSDTVYGLGAGIFFVGYFAFETPANVILYRVGARLWLARIMVSWGLVSAATLFVRTPGAFYAMRFLLGVAEAGFFPGVVLYLTQWFPAARRGRALAAFMTGMPLAGVLGGPVSGWIMQHMNGVGGLATWQWLFAIEALPSIVLGVLLFLVLPNSAADAHWLAPAERRWIVAQIDVERHAKADTTFLAMLADPRVWLCSLINFSFVMGLYGVGFWLPALVKKMGIHDNFAVGCLTAIPWLGAVVAMLAVGRSADRLRERRWHVALPGLAAALGFVLSTLLVGTPAFAIAALTLATAGVITTLPLFWSLPTAFLKDRSGAAGIGLINSLGGLAGFVSPFLTGWLNDALHDSRYGMWMLAAWCVLGAALVLALPARLVNR
jgi:MFS family permease